MAETITEFSVALFLDADIDAEAEIANLLSGQYEVDYLGEWMTLNDAFRRPPSKLSREGSLKPVSSTR